MIVKSPGAIIAYFRAISSFSDDAAILAPLSDQRPFVSHRSSQTHLADAQTTVLKAYITNILFDFGLSSAAQLE